jgi:large subunit ribosomal protein L4
MVDVPLYNPEGKSVGTLEIDEKVFGDKVRRRLLHQGVILYEANRYIRTASAKTRDEVAGAGKKLWPQKHTGRARMGSIRSPIWKGGGVVFPPKPRSNRVTISRRTKKEALKSALLGKLRDKELSVIEKFDVAKPSTKAMARTLKAIGLDRSVLIGVPETDRNLWLSTRNIPKVSVTPVTDWNAYAVLKHRALLVTRAALEKLGPKEGGWIRSKKS